MMDESKIYFELTIAASSPTTEIWLGCSDGHFVQKATGLLESSLMPGDYVVEFGLGSETFAIPLDRSRDFTEEQLRQGAPCPRPVVQLDLEDE